MNTLIITGRIATDITSTTVNDTALVKFRVAVPRRNKDAAASFFPVVVWGKQAEAISRFLAKGSRICLQGRLEQNTWESKTEVDADGKPRKFDRVEIVAESVEFLDPPKVKEPVVEAAPAVDLASAVWTPPTVASTDGDAYPALQGVEPGLAHGALGF